MLAGSPGVAIAILSGEAQTDNSRQNRRQPGPVRADAPGDRDRLRDLGAPYRPLLAAPPATGRESTEAAVATAHYLVLAAVLPAQADRPGDSVRLRPISSLRNGPAASRAICGPLVSIPSRLRRCCRRVVPLWCHPAPPYPGMKESSRWPAPCW
jgi:hypothetical protein